MCKTCGRHGSRNLVSSQLYEYSKARFFEQFFYNDKLKVKPGAFPCDHGSHPLRDYIIEFAVEQCKIQFRYTITHFKFATFLEVNNNIFMSTMLESSVRFQM